MDITAVTKANIAAMKHDFRLMRDMRIAYEQTERDYDANPCRKNEARSDKAYDAYFGVARILAAAIHEAVPKISEPIALHMALERESDLGEKIERLVICLIGVRAVKGYRSDWSGIPFLVTNLPHTSCS